LAAVVAPVQYLQSSDSPQAGMSMTLL